MTDGAPREVAELRSAISLLLETLDSAQLTAIRVPFRDTVERRNWHFIPRRRQGLDLADMHERQRKYVHRILAIVLQRHAYAQVAIIMALENVLDEWESSEWGRDALDYAMTVFGDPVEDSCWGWRFEGHHASLHITVSEDQVISSTPVFFGSNPASVSYHGTGVVRPLPLEEDLARSFLDSLTPKQRAQAIVSEVAPPDILTYNQPLVGGELMPLGLSAASLRLDSRDILVRLVKVYGDRVRFHPSGSAALVSPESGLAELHFAWEGAPGIGEPHYYRIQGPRLLIEYDNTQNGANHIQSVVRDPVGDFGDDPLRRHLSQEHYGGG